MWQRHYDQHPAGPKTPQELDTSDEEAEAMPVESELNGAEINGSHDLINNKRKIDTLVNFKELNECMLATDFGGFPFVYFVEKLYVHLV